MTAFGDPITWIRVGLAMMVVGTALSPFVSRKRSLTESVQGLALIAIAVVAVGVRTTPALHDLGILIAIAAILATMRQWQAIAKRNIALYFRERR